MRTRYNYLPRVMRYALVTTVRPSRRLRTTAVVPSNFCLRLCDCTYFRSCTRARARYRILDQFINLNTLRSAKTLPRSLDVHFRYLKRHVNVIPCCAFGVSMIVRKMKATRSRIRSMKTRRWTHRPRTHSNLIAHSSCHFTYFSPAFFLSLALIVRLSLFPRLIETRDRFNTALDRFNTVIVENKRRVTTRHCEILSPDT